jgi:predicted alpha/beta-fold hydrolase
MYHAGLTHDTLKVIEQIRTEHPETPVYLIGYSLGGNVSLKLAGELGERGHELLTGVAGVSTPIDLGACVRAMSKLENRIYEWRFLTRLKERIRTRAKDQPGVYRLDVLDRVKSVYEFDDKITAPYFGFGTADNYYETQSSKHFLDRIRVPTLLVQAKDDPLIPFDIFDHPAIRDNRHIRLVAPEHGGHLGFLSNGYPRFWVDRVLIEWITEVGNKVRPDFVSSL